MRSAALFFVARIFNCGSCSLSQPVQLVNLNGT